MRNSAMHLLVAAAVFVVTGSTYHTTSVSPLSDQQLLDLIHQQPPLSSGQLKTILLDNSPLSDTVLIAAFTRQPGLPNGIISEIALANSPLSNKVLFVLKDLDPPLPPGILNEVFAENTLTIHGRLLNNAGCDTSLQLAGVEVALADLSGNPVTSAALTGLQGEFSLDPDEVAALNPSALFTFLLNSDIPLSFSAPRTPEDWMRQSPVALFAENTLSASFTFAFTSNACFDFFNEDFPEVDFAADFPGGVAPYTYQWDFGDGNDGEGDSPSNVYEEPGVFTVSLTVIDSLRCVSVAQQQIAIENCPMGVVVNNDACGGGPAGGVVMSIRLLIQEEGVNELLFEDFIATTNAAGEFSFDPDDINDLRDDLNDLYPVVPLVAFEPVEGFDIEDQQFVPIDELIDNFPLALTLTQSAIAWHRHEGEALLKDAIGDDPRASVATAIDVHGHVFVAGAIMDEVGNTGSTSFGVIKYDRSGNVLWIREFANATGNHPGNTPTAITVTGDCEVYVTGVGAEGGGVTHYLTVKYDATGNLLWSRTYTGSPSVSSQNGARAIAQDACGNIYVTGRTTDGSAGDFGDYGTVKYDPEGNMLWAATYKGPATGAGKMDEALAITAAGGKVFVTGFSRGATSRDIATVAYDESGNELWAARYNGAGNGGDLARGIAADITGNVYVTGYSTESGSDRDMIVIKYDAEGDELWTAHHPGAAGAGDEAFALAVHSDGSVYVTGAAADTNLQFPDAFYAAQGEDGGLYDFDMVTNRYDTDGSLLWSRSYDGAGATLDGAFDIALDQNGNAYVTGVTHSLAKNKAGFAFAFSLTGFAMVNGPGFGTIQIDPPPLVSFGTGEATTLSYDADGGERWVHTYKGAGNSQDGFFALALDDEGGVYATGFSALVDTVTFDVNVKMSTVKVGQCDGAGAAVGLVAVPEPSRLTGEFCNAVGLSLSSVLEAESITGISGYDFLIENPNLDFSFLHQSDNNLLDLTLVPGLINEMSYVVSVRTRVCDEVSGFGQRCQVTIDPLLENECGFDEVIRDLAESDPLVMDIFNARLQTVLDFMDENTAQTQSIGDCSGEAVFTVPVVVHVVYDPALPAGNIPDQQILDQIARLNLDFNGPHPDALPGVGVNTCIQFCIAQNAPDGRPWSDFNANGTPGITRTASAVFAYDQRPSSPPVSSLIGFNPQEYLNIWVVESISGAAGYVVLPFVAPFDGIVIRNGVFDPSGPTLGTTLAHEAGHYFNMLHPFGVESTSPCVVSNCPGGSENAYDFICDTPPLEFPTRICSQTASFLCPPAGAALLEDYMDYTGGCRTTFTQGQKEFMQSAILAFQERSRLVGMANLIRTGVAGPGGCVPADLTAEFTADRTNICFGDAVAFTGTDIPGKPVTYQFTGSNGTNNFDSGILNTRTFTYTFSNAGDVGVWNISLTVSDGTASVTNSVSQMIYVTDCQPIFSEQGVWHFGQSQSLDFSSGAPVAKPSPNNGREGVASIADPVTGLTLFHADQNSIYDASGVTMVNGSGIDGNSSAAQGKLIVPDPGSPQRYYLFSVSASEVPGTGMSYSTVDISLKGNGTITAPLGEVVAGSKNIPIQSPNNPPTTEHLSAIPHCNGTSMWIITRGDGTQILAYELTASGILPLTSSGAPNPVVSASAVSVDIAQPIGGVGSIDVARSSRRVAITYLAGLNTTEIYDFNNETGEFRFVTNISGGYQPCFSPSGNVLYTVATSGIITQHDLTSFSACNPGIPSFQTRIEGYGGFIPIQIGPDDKIYLGSSSVPKLLSVIHFPDRINNSTIPNNFGLNPHSVPLATVGFMQIGFPNMVDAVQVPTDDFTFCFQNCSTVVFTNLGCGTAFAWDFAGLGASNLENPSFTFPGPGTYTVTLSIDGRSPVAKDVNVNLPPVPVITGDRPACLGDPVAYTTGLAGLAHQWAIGGAGDGTILGPDNQESIVIDWGPAGGTVLVTVTDPLTGCVNTGSLNVAVSAAPVVTINTADFTICTTDPAVTLSATPAGGVWSGAGVDRVTGVFDPIQAGPGLFTISYEFIDPTTRCTGSDDMQITVDASCADFCVPPATISIPPGQALATAYPCTGKFCFENEVVDISGTFLVNQSFTIDASDIRMAPGASIEIAAGKTLEIINGSRIFGCPDMWAGIKINTDATLNVSGNSSIEDAGIAVQLPQTRGTANLDNAILNKNYINVSITHSIGNTLSNGSTFRASRFTCAGSLTSPGNTLKAPRDGQRSFAGIVLEGTGTGQDDHVVIGDPASGPNVFDNLDYGIRGTDVNILIRNNLFRNLTGEPTVQCPPFSICPDPVGIAIFAADPDFTFGGAEDANKIIIGGGINEANGFTNCFRAVDLLNYVEVTMTGNTIENPGQPGTLQQPVGDHGVFVKNKGWLRLLDLRQNHISNTFTAVHLLQQTTLNTFFVRMTDNTVQANGSGIVHTGIFIEDSFSPLDPALPILIAGNDMFRVRNGIRSRMVSGAIIENNFIDLIPTFTGAGIRAEGGKIVVRANEITSTNSDFSLTRERFRGIYATLASGSDINCNRIKNMGQSMVFEDIMPSRVENNEMTNARDGLVLLNNGQIGPQGASGKPSDNVWAGSYLNSQTLTHNTVGANTHSPLWVRPGVRTNPTDNETNSANPSIDQYNPLTTGGPHRSCPLPEEPVIGPLGAIAAGNDSSFSVFPEETRWLVKFMTFESILEDSTGQLHAAHQGFCDSISKTNIGKICRIGKLFREGNLGMASIENNALQPSCTIERNHKDFNAMLLAWMEGNDEAISIPALYAIASQCPLQGGFAVYQARTLLNAISDRVNEFEDNCPVVAASKTNEAPAAGPEETFEYRLYPNPSDGTMQLDYRLGWKETGRFEVYDLAGRQRITEQLENDKATLYIKLEDLPAGAYLYRIIVNKEARAGDKLIIIK